MRDLLVFTWNLKHNVEAAALAISHLTSWPNNGVSWIAALQEPPRALAALLKEAGNVRVHGPTTDHNAILSSDDIVLDPDGRTHARNPTVDINDRMAGAPSRARTGPASASSLSMGRTVAIGRPKMTGQDGRPPYGGCSRRSGAGASPLH